MTDHYLGPSPHSKEGRIHPPSMNAALGSLNPNVLKQGNSNDKRQILRHNVSDFRQAGSSVFYWCQFPHISKSLQRVHIIFLPFHFSSHFFRCDLRYKVVIRYFPAPIKNRAGVNCLLPTWLFLQLFDSTMIRTFSERLVVSEWFCYPPQKYVQ